MSTNITTTVDIDLDTVEVTNSSTLDQVTTTCTADVDISETTSLVEGYKKEYSIVGDGLYASLSTDEAPLWLTSLIDSVVNASIANGMTDYDLLVQDVRNAIDTIDVAKNTYVQEIDVSAIADGIVTSKLETLNATYGETFATKADLTTAVAAAEYTIAQDISDLSVGFGEDLTSRITAVQTAFADADSALSDDITALETVFEDQEANLSALAEATSGLQTYIGLTSGGEPDGTGILSELAVLQKQADGTIDTYTGTHELLENDMDGDPDTTGMLFDQWPYALWVPMSGTTDPVATTREAYEGIVASQYDIEPHTVYHNTTADTYWEYHPITAGGWEEITASEYTSRLTTVRDLHIGDSYIRYEYDGGQKNYIEAYKFIKTVADTTAPYSTDPEGYGWAVVTDTAAQAAYVAALNAYALADGKISQFYAWYSPDDLPPQDQVINENTADEYTIPGASFMHWLDRGVLLSLVDNHHPSAVFMNNVNATGANENLGSDFREWAFSLAPNGYSYFDFNQDGTWNATDLLAIIDVYNSVYNLYYDPYGYYAHWEEVVRPSLMQQPWFTDEFLTTGWDVNTNVSTGDIVNAYNSDTRDYTLFTYNGSAWEQSGPEGIISQSTYFIDLKNEVIAPDGGYGNSLAALKLDSEAYADSEGVRVENKFGYNSDIILNGQYYKSGFGLDASGITSQTGDGTEGNAFDSEFWINAERFVLKSPTYPGVSASFTVTDSGLYLSTDYTEATRNEPKGEYSSLNTYYKGDVVTYNNSSFTALKTVTNITPSSDGINWQLLAAQGAGNETIYITSTQAPSTPSPSAATPTGWSSTLPVKTDNIWVSIGSKDLGVENYTWGAPAMLSEHTSNMLLSQKMLPWPEGVESSGAVTEGGTWLYYGQSVENSTVLIDDPFGGKSVAWRCTNKDTDVNDEGGFKSPAVTLPGTDKYYRISAFMRKSSSSGTSIMGLRDEEVTYWYPTTSSWVTTSSVSLFQSDLPSYDDWYLVVAHIRPYGDTSTELREDSGVYRVSDGVKVNSYVRDCSFTQDTTSVSLSLIGSLYGDSSTELTTSDIWNPRIDVMDDRAPTITELLRKSKQGQTFKEIFLYANGATAPALPSISGSYNSSTGAAEDEDNWVVTPSAPAAGESTWRTSLTLVKISDQSSWTNQDSAWGTAIKVSGTDAPIPWGAVTDYQDMYAYNMAALEEVNYSNFVSAGRYSFYTNGDYLLLGPTALLNTSTTEGVYFRGASSGFPAAADVDTILFCSKNEYNTDFSNTYNLLEEGTYIKYKTPNGEVIYIVNETTSIGTDYGFDVYLVKVSYISGSTYVSGTAGGNPVSFTFSLGQVGADGPAGAGFYGGSYTSIETVTANITSRFTAVTSRAPVLGDVFTQVNTSTDPSTSVSKRYNGTNWVAPELVVTGDMIVEGGITAQNLAATNLSGLFVDAGEITAGKLRSSDSNFIIDLNNKFITITV